MNVKAQLHQKYFLYQYRYLPFDYMWALLAGVNTFLSPIQAVDHIHKSVSTVFGSVSCVCTNVCHYLWRGAGSWRGGEGGGGGC